MRVNPSAQLHAILAYFAITALANDFIEFEIAIFDVEDPAEAVQVSLVDLYRGAVQDASLQTFCEQHSLDLRPCADLLNAVDRGRAQPHADPFRLAVMIEKPIIPTRLPIDSLSMDQMLGMHLLLYVMHGREVLDDHGYFVFPPEVKRVVIDVGAHHCEHNPDVYVFTHSYVLSRRRANRLPLGP